MLLGTIFHGQFLANIWIFIMKMNIKIGTTGQILFKDLKCNGVKKIILEMIKNQQKYGIHGISN